MKKIYCVLLFCFCTSHLFAQSDSAAQHNLKLRVLPFLFLNNAELAYEFQPNAKWGAQIGVTGHLSSPFYVMFTFVTAQASLNRYLEVDPHVKLVVSPFTGYRLTRFDGRAEDGWVERTKSSFVGLSGGTRIIFPNKRCFLEIKGGVSYNWVVSDRSGKESGFLPEVEFLLGFPIH